MPRRWYKLLFRGQAAYLRADRASLRALGTRNGRYAYDFDAAADADGGVGAVPQTGTEGNHVRRDWTQESVSARLPRMLRFDFDLNADDASVSNREVAVEYGWHLRSAEASGNEDGSRMRWNSDDEGGGRQVRVPSSDDLFVCDYFRIDFTSSDDGREWRFVARGRILIGAYLDASGYKVNKLGRYDPCPDEGEVCRAVNGNVECVPEAGNGNGGGGGGGGGGKNPPKPGSDVSSQGEEGEGKTGGKPQAETSPTSAAVRYDLVWRAPSAYLRALGASLRITDSSIGRDAYDFDAGATVPYSGIEGGYIQREEWYQDGGIKRMVKFDLALNVDNAFGTAQELAQERGWHLRSVEAYGNEDGSLLRWSSNDDGNGRQVWVSSSYELFECDYFRLDMDADDGGTWTFEAADGILIGGYMEKGYRLNRMGRYNPCPDGQGCKSAVNGKIQCAATTTTTTTATATVDPKNPPKPGPGSGPGSGQASPGNPEVQVQGEIPSTSAAAPVGVVWDGPRAYLGGGASVITDDGSDYSLAASRVNDGTCKSGGCVRAEWTESGVDRMIEFEAQRGWKTDWPFVYEAIMSDGDYVRGSTDGSHFMWSRSSRSFGRYMIQIPQGFDLFRCDYVEFNFKHKRQTWPGATLKVDDFTVGFYLGTDYNAASLSVFNPCESIDQSICSGCKCSLVDDDMTCGGESVKYGDVYDVTTFAGVGTADVPFDDSSSPAPDEIRAGESGATEARGGTTGTCAAMVILAVLLSRMGLA